MENKPLTAKQEAFARNYVANGFNGFQAAVKAGYAEESARVEASRLLTNANVAAFIEELKKPVVAKSRRGAEDVYRQAENAAFFDVRKVLKVRGNSVEFSVDDFAQLNEEDAQMIQAIEQKVTMYGTTIKVTFLDKLKALEMLARFNGMNKDKLEVTTNLTEEERKSRIAELKAKLEADGTNQG